MMQSSVFFTIPAAIFLGGCTSSNLAEFDPVTKADFVPLEALLNAIECELYLGIEHIATDKGVPWIRQQKLALDFSLSITDQNGGSASATIVPSGGPAF